MKSSTPTKSMAGRQEETHWDEDQRRALAHSHMRTLHELEDGDADGPARIVSARDPGTNILPSVPSISEQEQASKKRSFDNANNNDAQGAKSAKSKGSPLTISFRRIWGNADLGKSGDDETFKSDSKDDSNRSWTRKRQCLTLTCMVVVVASVVTIALMPSMRISMQAGVSRMVTEGETVLAHGNKEQLIFSGGNLWTNMAGDVQMQVDGLYSPNYYPIADTLPVLWMMPQSGSEVVLDVLMYCLRLTAASGMGVGDQEREVSCDPRHIFSAPKDRHCNQFLQYCCLFPPPIIALIISPPLPYTTVPICPDLHGQHRPLHQCRHDYCYRSRPCRQLVHGGIGPC
jgi:hypothetical protein